LPDQYLVAALICLFGGGLFSLAEGALRGLSGKRLENLLRTESARGGRFTSFYYRRTEIVLTARLISFTGLLAWIAVALWEYLDLGESGSLSFLKLLEVLAAATAIAAIAGRIIPLRIGRRLSARFSATFLVCLRAIWMVLMPLIWLHRVVSNLADRTFGPSREESEEKRITEEVMSAVAEGERADVIEEEQKEMIKSILEFGDADVSEIMTPRVNMVSIATDTPTDKAVKFCAEHHFSRIPAFQETRDNITGILYVKDLLRYINGGQTEKSDTIRPILREPLLVPETKKARDLLQEFQKKKIHAAIVLDEYGGTAGIVTLEDVLEEIVGEIRDEYEVGEEPTIVHVSEDVAEVKATAHVDEVNEALNTDLPESPEYETIAGLIFDILGRVPTQNEKINCNNSEITILRSDRRRIHRVRIRLRGQT